jgi:hypothetical protein
MDKMPSQPRKQSCSLQSDFSPKLGKADDLAVTQMQKQWQSKGLQVIGQRANMVKCNNTSQKSK